MRIAGRSRAARTGLAGAVLAGAILTTAGAGSASAAPAPVPCTNAGGGHYNCQFYVAGNGVSGGAPVQASNGARVGFLHKGTNWVVCQQAGGRVNYGGSTNNVWAWTLTDGTPRWGWVNAVYASGGANDGGFGGGVPSCNGAHGAPPAGAGAPAPPPGAPSPPPAPPPASKEPTGCDVVREDQRATVRFKYTLKEYTYDKSQVPAKPFNERNRVWHVGSMRIGAATCRTGGKWRILKPVSLSWDSKGIDPTPKRTLVGDRWIKGWGIAATSAKVPRKGAWPQIGVTMMRCTQGSLLRGVKELLGFPVPKLTFWWALLPWAASKQVPDDDIKCQQPAAYRVELRADKRGRMYVGATMTAFDPYTDETHIPDPGRPSTVNVLRIMAEEARVS